MQQLLTKDACDLMQIKDIEDEVRPAESVDAGVCDRQMCPFRCEHLVMLYGRLCLLQHLHVALQMAKTQKNKATSGHLGLLKVQSGCLVANSIKALMMPYSSSSVCCTVLPYC